MNNKPFKTYNQQLKILRNRGMIIKNGSYAIKILKRENYYSIINGYKDIFLDKNSKTEKFKVDTTFEDIYNLFEFDRNIRHLFLKYILRVENIINTKISYFFSKKYKKDFDYLNINNFNDKNLEKNTGLIASISSVIKDKSGSKFQNKNQISHYLTQHKSLPLWVLVKHFSFGITAYFYSSLDNDLKNEIVKEISLEYKKEQHQTIKLHIEVLENALHFLNVLRNKAAHNERFFNINNSKKKINYPHSTETFKGRLIDSILILKLFLMKEDYKRFLQELENEINSLKGNINSSIMNKILIEMGLPKNWKERVKEYKLNH